MEEILSELRLKSEKIRVLYTKLFSLEIKNNKNSLEYENLLSQLKDAIEEENNLYNEIGKDYDLTVKLLNSLFKHIPTYEDYLYIMYEYFDRKIVENRIAYRLQEIIYSSSLPTEVNDEYVEDDYQDNLEEEQDHLNSIELSLEKDLTNTIMKILNEYINDAKYQSISYELIRFKYLLSFTFNYLEKDLIENNFEISEYLFLITPAIVDIYNEPQTLLNILTDDYTDDLLCELTEYLLNSYDIDVLEHEYYYKLILTQIVLRAVVSFANPISLDNLKNLVESEIKEANINNKELLDIIYNSFNRREFDIEIPYVISLKIRH